jgi:hypothetical protein
LTEVNSCASIASLKFPPLYFVNYLESFIEQKPSW